MNIKELYLQNFGKFENFRLNLESGFNLIYGENEVGKSTIMDFVMLMFYGHKGRKRDIRENPRRRYQPWNGRQMQGQIIFKSKGQSYRLER
ncbi:MAG: AAA family ATPase, partial [Clostridiaceae bacterium]|nr:AAA family ATPase [Clostridiaceae bacterium]